MGYPTFNAYPSRDKKEILIEKLREDNPFHFDLPPKPTSIEEINNTPYALHRGCLLWIPQKKNILV